MANLFLNVGLNITHHGDGEPRLKISLWGDLDYAVHFNPQLHCANVNRMMSEEGIFQYSHIQNNELYGLSFIYDRAAPLNELQAQAPIGILPMFWYWEEEIGWEAPPIFRGNEAAELCELLVENNFASGWTDEEFIARVLMSGDAQFHPIIPESSPTGGVLPAGSVGAALFHNARSASPPNRITQLLIDRVALTAETGLRFYDAMIDDVRAAIHRI